jgi:hypothetical protein
MFSEPNDNYVLRLPYDKNTCKIRHGQRFIVSAANGEPLVYKVVLAKNYDPGIPVELKLNADFFNEETDNLQDGITDYTDKPPIDEERGIRGADKIRAGGTYKYTCKNALQWGYTELPDCVTAEEEGAELVLAVTYLEKDIGKKTLLNCDTTDGTEYKEIVVSGGV